MVIKLKLLDDWIISSDSRQYILGRMEDDNFVAETFHPSIADCFQEFLERKIRGFNAESIELLIKEIKVLRKDCMELLRTLEDRLVSAGGGSNGE